MEEKSGAAARKKEECKIYRPPQGRYSKKPDGKDPNPSAGPIITKSLQNPLQRNKHSENPLNISDASKQNATSETHEGRGRRGKSHRGGRAQYRNNTTRDANIKGGEIRCPSPSQSITSQSSRRSNKNRGQDKRKRGGHSYRGRNDERGSRQVSPTDSLHSVMSATDLNSRNRDNQTSNRGKRYSNQNRNFNGTNQGYNNSRENRIGVDYERKNNNDTSKREANDVRLMAGNSNKTAVRSQVFTSSKIIEKDHRPDFRSSRIDEPLARPSPPISEITDFSDLNSLDNGPLNWSREVEEYNTRLSESERQETQAIQSPLPRPVPSARRLLPSMQRAPHMPPTHNATPSPHPHNVPPYMPPTHNVTPSPHPHNVPPYMPPTHNVTPSPHPHNEELGSWYQPKSTSRGNKPNQRRDREHELPPRFQKRLKQNLNISQSPANSKQNRCSTDQESIRIQAEHEYWPIIKGCVLELERKIHEASNALHYLDVKGLIALSTQISFNYRGLIMLDAEYTFRQNVDTMLWKHAFYLPSECIRRICEQSVKHENNMQFARDMMTCWLAFLEKSEGFYRELLIEYEKVYNFCMDDYIIMDPGNNHLISLIPLKSESKSHLVKVALLSCQRFLIALGDLARYKETARHILPCNNISYNFNNARILYLKAVQLSPGNGKPYNQLGLLARYTNRHMECIYYLVRCVSAKHPFSLSYETQQSAFNDIARKVKQYEEQVSKEVRDQRADQGIATPPLAQHPAYRREIWKGGLSEAAEKIESRKDKEMQVLLQRDAAELYKRCHLYLLNAVGMLITKINMDQFECIAERGLIQLEALLEREESPLRCMHLLQLSVIFLHCVHKTTSKETEEGTCSMLQHRAVQLVFSLWGLLLKHVDVLLDNAQDLNAADPKSLLLVLPAIKLLNSWISTPDNYKIYSSLPSLDGLQTDKFCVPVWKHLVSLCNCFTKMEQNNVLPEKVHGIPKKDHIAVTLPEDVLAASFYNVFESSPSKYYIHKENSLSTWATIIRLKSVQQTTEFLHGMDLDPPKLAVDESAGLFIVASSDRSRESSPSPPTNRRRRASELDEESIDDDSTVELTQAVSQLKLQTDAEKMKQVAFERECEGAGIVIEVNPSILIPDTNAFIDHLASLKKLINLKKFDIYCSTVVYKELEGLSKNTDNEWVSEQAKEATEMVKEMVADSSTKVKVVTTKGNTLHSTICNEEFEYTPNSKEQNDDRILNTCLHFVSDETNRQREVYNTRDEPLRLIRKVVLLTADRPLRIKATSKDVPARSIPSFMQWFGIK